MCLCYRCAYCLLRQRIFILFTILCTGPYLFGLVDSLPDEAFDALVGNDLDPPRFHDPSLSVNAVTRSQTAALRSAVTDQNPVPLRRLQFYLRPHLRISHC